MNSPQLVFDVIPQLRMIHQKVHRILDATHPNCDTDVPKATQKRFPKFRIEFCQTRVFVREESSQEFGVITSFFFVDTFDFEFELRQNS